MSLKSIDMQMALHKNSDAGIQQSQLLHKPEADQAALAQAGMKAAEAKRQRSAKVDQTAEGKIRDGGKGKREHRPGKATAASGTAPAENSASGKTGEEFEHPFKGHHIDLSL